MTTPAPRTCHPCWKCQPETSPAHLVVRGITGPDRAPVLVAAWLAVVERLSDEYWTARRPLVLEVAHLTGAAPSTVQNIIRAAAELGIVDQSTVRGDSGGRRAYLKLPTTTTERPNR